MNKDKSIKDLKKRNDQLAYQYRMRDIRCITLERRIEKYEQQITQLTNNWNELEEWVKSEYNRYYNDTENLVLSNVETMDYSRMLDKMKEIKEGKDND